MSNDKGDDSCWSAWKFILSLKNVKNKFSQRSKLTFNKWIRIFVRFYSNYVKFYPSLAAKAPWSYGIFRFSPQIWNYNPLKCCFNCAVNKFLFLFLTYKWQCSDRILQKVYYNISSFLLLLFLRNVNRNKHIRHEYKQLAIQKVLHISNHYLNHHVILGEKNH